MQTNRCENADKNSHALNFSFKGLRQLTQKLLRIPIERFRILKNQGLEIRV